MIYRLLSVLFLVTVAFTANLKARVNQAGFGYFIIRNEWDDRCVAYMNNVLRLESNCKLAQSVWESTKGVTQNVAVKNYFGGRYLSFISGNPNPQMLETPAGNSRFNFQVVHPRNRRYPNNRTYWGVTYHVIRNAATGLCLMVNGDLMKQQQCNPSKPEHLSFEEVPFNPSWVKSPERVADEKKVEQAKIPIIPPPPVVLPPLPPLVIVLPPVPATNPPRRPCRKTAY